MSELDDFFANLPENQDDESLEMTPKHVEILCNVIERMAVAAMGNSNQLSITLTRVQPEGPVVWATNIHGTPIIIDTFQELVGALSRLS